ncbi:MAG: amidohydrolase family protein, partial [Chloroflexota bacterium]
DGHEAGDPYYYPLYAAAERLGLPICFHQGTSDPTLSNAIETARLAEFNVLAAFSSLAEHAVPDRFPELRFGFIEAGASWIPYLLKCLGMRGKAENAPYNFKMGFLAHNRFYVTCDTEDDVRTLLEFGAEDYLMIGTDYSHADQSSEIRAHQVITERGQRGELSPAVAGKIVSGNARRFYGL